MQNARVLVLVASMFMASSIPSLAVSPDDAPRQLETCDHPNLPALVVRAAVPRTPPAARQLHLQGQVHVRFHLNAKSEVTSATISRSPSLWLNAPSIAAARESQYRTEVVDCVPKEGDYIFVVEFTDNSPPFKRPDIANTFVGSWRCAASDGFSADVSFRLSSTGMVLDETRQATDNFKPATFHQSGDEVGVISGLRQGLSSGWTVDRIVFVGSDRASIAGGFPPSVDVPMWETFIKTSPSSFTHEILTGDPIGTTPSVPQAREICNRAA